MKKTLALVTLGILIGVATTTASVYLYWKSVRGDMEELMALNDLVYIYEREASMLEKSPNTVF